MKLSKLPPHQRYIILCHRYLGGTLAIFLILFIITGVLLNHSEELNLSQKHINLPNKLKTQQTESQCQPLRGVIAIKDLIIIACSQQIALITQKGKIIEQLTTTQLPPGNIQTIAKDQNELIIKTEQGTYRYDENIITWKPTEPKNYNWTPTKQLPAKLKKQLTKNNPTPGKPLTDFLLNLHTLKIIGPAGKWLLDIIALALLILTLTGLLKWIMLNKEA